MQYAAVLLQLCIDMSLTFNVSSVTRFLDSLGNETLVEVEGRSGKLAGVEVCY